MIPADYQPKLEAARRCLLAHDFTGALARYQKLTRDRPGEAAMWAEYGNAASGAGQVELADRCWQQALGLAPRNAELVGMIGHQYQGIRLPEKAGACFAQAAAADPRSINPRISLAVLLEKNHRLQEARQAVEECLAISQHDDQARYFAAVLDRREGQVETAERRLRDLIASDPRHPYVRYACRYELAQVLDRDGRCDEAMQQLADAKRLVRGLTDTEALLKGYDQSAESGRRFTRNLPRTILRTWAEQYPEGKREPIPRLAFLGGHPRSGTTLLEQVLDPHPEVAALDEPTAFLDILQPEFHKSKVALQRPVEYPPPALHAGPAARGGARRDRQAPARQEPVADRAAAALAEGVSRAAGAHRLA